MVYQFSFGRLEIPQNKQLNIAPNFFGNTFFHLHIYTRILLFLQLSHWRLYNEHYNWLLYDRTADLDNFRRIFTDANLAVDAELTYAILKPTLPRNLTEASNISYIAYDVYNNGRFLGGKLNMTLDREFECNLESCYIKRNISALHTRTKYGNRNLLHDITMRVTVVVSGILVSEEKLFS